MFYFIDYLILLFSLAATTALGVPSARIFTAIPDIDGARIRRRLISDFVISKHFTLEPIHWLYRSLRLNVLPKTLLLTENKISLDGQLALSFGEYITRYAPVTEYLVAIGSIDEVAIVNAEAKILWLSNIHNHYHEHNMACLQNIASEIRSIKSLAC